MARRVRWSSASVRCLSSLHQASVQCLFNGWRAEDEPRGVGRRKISGRLPGKHRAQDRGRRCGSHVSSSRGGCGCRLARISRSMAPASARLKPLASPVVCSPERRLRWSRQILSPSPSRTFQRKSNTPGPRHSTGPASTRSTCKFRPVCLPASHLSALRRNHQVI